MQGRELADTWLVLYILAIVISIISFGLGFGSACIIF